jgi:hypothetical protein
LVVFDKSRPDGRKFLDAADVSDEKSMGIGSPISLEIDRDGEKATLLAA